MAQRKTGYSSLEGKGRVREPRQVFKKLQPMPVAPQPMPVNDFSKPLIGTQIVPPSISSLPPLANSPPLTNYPNLNPNGQRMPVAPQPMPVAPPQGGGMYNLGSALPVNNVNPQVGSLNRQQGGGLFGMPPDPAMNAQPNFNLNLAPQALSDPRGAYVPPADSFAPPPMPTQSYAGLNLADYKDFLPVYPSALTDEAIAEGAPVGVGSPDTMYDYSGGASMGTTGIEYYSPPTRYEDEGTRDFDNAMDTAGIKRDKASAFNTLYGGMTALPSGEASRNAFTESSEGQAYLQAERDALDQNRMDYDARTGTATQYGDPANLREDYNRMLAGETTGVSGKSLIELGIVSHKQGTALMKAGVPSPVFSNYDPALAAEFDYSPENIAGILAGSHYMGPRYTGPPIDPASEPPTLADLAKSDPASYNAIMSSMARPPMPDPNALPYIAPIDYSGLSYNQSGGGNQGGGGAARKANGGGVMSLYPNY